MKTLIVWLVQLLSLLCLKFWKCQTYQKSAKAQLFLDTLLNSSDDQLRDFLMGTPAFSLLGNTELVGTLRSIITTYLTPHTHNSIGDFSFRDYLKMVKAIFLLLGVKIN